MSGALVVRFSSLGDIVLSGAVTGALAPVTYVTSSRFESVVARLPGVERVVTLQPGESVSALAARVERHPVQIDLHASPRSRALCRKVGGSWRRVERYDLRRRLRVAFKGKPAPPVVSRYGAAAEVSPAMVPWIDLGERGDSTVLIPGAAHATKRWPARRWVELGRALGGTFHVLGGPDEIDLCNAVAAGIGSEARAVAETGFEGAFASLAQASRAIGSDSGLMHLAAACGLQCFTVFGPTSSDDGFWEGRCTPIEQEFACRPCSRFGGSWCPMGDHHCMSSLSVETTLGVVQA